jgi:hypothetical protein
MQVFSFEKPQFLLKNLQVKPVLKKPVSSPVQSAKQNNFRVEITDIKCRSNIFQYLSPIFVPKFAG